MTFIDFIRLLLRNKLLLIFTPIVLSLSVYVFTKNNERDFVSKCLIYTGMASGMDISSMDNPMANFTQANNSFDNLITTIKSRQTMEDLAIKLMATHLQVKHPDPTVISQKDFDRLHELLKPDEIRKLYAPSVEECYQKIMDFKNSSQLNPITKILESKKEIYSINVIGKNLIINRKQSSDMLEIVYTAHDPIIAQSTLQLLIDLISIRYKSLKSDESTDVISYFEEQIQVALNELNNDEENLKEFCIRHGILNYQEQSKFLSEAKINAETALDAEKQAYQAAKESEKKISDQMSARQKTTQTNGEIMQMQAQLAKVNNLMASAEIAGNQKLKEKYKEQSIKLKNAIQKSVNDMYGHSNSEEGVPKNTLMNNYLDKSLNVEESKSKIKVIEERLGNFSREYQSLAPVGSEIKKLERKILISEQKYLAATKNYEEAKLKKKSIELGKNLSIVDAPNYPMKSEPSKRLIMVIAAFMLGFIIPTSTLLALHLLDNSIRTPIRLEQITNLKVSGVWPQKIDPRDEVEVALLEKMLLDQFNSGLILEEREMGIEDQQLRKMLLFSIKPGEGKSHFGIRLANQLSSGSRKILYFYPHQSKDTIQAYFKEQDKNDSLTAISYLPDTDFVNAENQDYLFNTARLNQKDYHTVIVELPALLNTQLPVNIIRDGDVSLLLVNSQRVWTASDAHMLELYHKALGHTKTSIILNKISLDNLENLLGTIPKKRSKFRLFIKQLIALDFAFLNKKS